MGGGESWGQECSLRERWQRLLPLGIALDPRNPECGATLLPSPCTEVAIPEPGEGDTLQVIAA